MKRYLTTATSFATAFGLTTSIAAIVSHAAGKANSADQKDLQELLNQHGLGGQIVVNSCSGFNLGPFIHKKFQLSLRDGKEKLAELCISSHSSKNYCGVEVKSTQYGKRNHADLIAVLGQITHFPFLYKQEAGFRL